MRAATYVAKGGVGKTTGAAHIAVVAHGVHDLDLLLIESEGTQNDLATRFGLADSIENPAPRSLRYSATTRSSSGKIFRMLLTGWCSRLTTGRI